MADFSATHRPDFRALLAALPSGWREKMFEQRLILEHPDTVLDDPDTLMHLVLLHVGCDLPLRQSVEWMAKAGEPEVSHVTLHRKMTHRPFPGNRSAPRKTDVGNHTPAGIDRGRRS